MSRIITIFIQFIAKIHTKILSLNNIYNISLTDKQLHFLVIGILGFIMLVIIQPIFSYLSKKDGVIWINFFYTLSAIIAISFAIEIGQGWSGSGEMDFYDIVSGLVGFFVFFAIYLIIYIIHRYFKNKRNK